MACDFTFAYMLEDVYARRYMEFRDEDIDWICERCHQAYHKYTKKYLNAVIRWNQYALVHVRKDYREMLELKRIEMLQRYLKWKIRRIKRLQKQD